jgi:bacterioferritin-associated ferredoxin
MKNAGTRRRVLCACLGVTEGRVAAVVKSGRACTVNEVMACTEAGTGCTACHRAIQEVVERHSCPATAPLAQRATG